MNLETERAEMLAAYDTEAVVNLAAVEMQRQVNALWKLERHAARARDVARARFALTEPPSMERAQLLAATFIALSIKTSGATLVVQRVGDRSTFGFEARLLAAASGLEVEDEDGDTYNGREKIEELAATALSPTWHPKVPEWIGVDFDGTMAQYTKWVGPDVLGEPIPEMVERVKRWLAAGHNVRIFTARVSVVWPEDVIAAGKARQAIEAWCVTHLGQKIPVTCTKDFAMRELYDDRAVTVEQNTGRLLSESTRGLEP